MKEKNLLSSLFSLGQLIRQHMHCLSGVSHSELEALKFIMEQGRPTMKSIARHMMIKPSSVTPIINSLAKSRHIKRIQDKSDRRIIYIEISKEGKKMLDSMQRRVKGKLNKIFSGLSRADKDNLAKIVDKLLKKNNYDEKK